MNMIPVASPHMIGMIVPHHLKTIGGQIIGQDQIIPRGFTVSRSYHNHRQFRFWIFRAIMKGVNVSSILFGNDDGHALNQMVL